MTELSLDEHWMPFTANRDFKAAPRLLTQASGVTYTDIDGQQVLDGCAGMFCCNAGHGRREIADAVAKQILDLDYISNYQIASPPAFLLAERLARMMPAGMDRIFFTNSGSEGVDTALKAALAYYDAKGETRRRRFVARERSFHGGNIAGTTLGGLVNNRRVFGAEMPGVVHMRHTLLEENRFARGRPQAGAELAEDLQRIAETYGGETIAACIVEPVAGSTGVLVPPEGYLERLREICDANGILLIYDEVITGFGRLGTAFGAQAFGVAPDIMVTAKALTNGTVPMGAVAVRRGIHDAVMDAAPDGRIEFSHGYTYSGHPVAAAAALATLDIYDNEGLFERAANLSPSFLDMVFSLEGLPAVADVRGIGMLGAFELQPGKGPEVMKALFAAGLHVKFTGDAGILAPALTMTIEDMARMGDILRDVLDKA